MQKSLLLPAPSLTHGAHKMLEEVLRLLEGKPLMEVADAARVPYNWLWRLSRGKVENPRLDRLEKLKAYLESL